MCIRYWLLEVGEHAGPFHSSGTNKNNSSTSQLCLYRTPLRRLPFNGFRQTAFARGMHHEMPRVLWFAFRYHLLSPTTAQLPALDPSTTVDIFPLYFPAVGWSDTYPIPPSFSILSNVQVYEAEFTTTVDFIKPYLLPLISISHRTSRMSLSFSHLHKADTLEAVDLHFLILHRQIPW